MLVLCLGELNLNPSSRASFATRSLCCVPVIASLFCDAISLLRVRHREPLLRRDLSDLHPSVHVLTARLLHHFAISTLTQHLRQHGKVIRNDGGVVIASLFCDAILVFYVRHREPLLRRDLPVACPSPKTIRDSPNFDCIYFLCAKSGINKIHCPKLPFRFRRLLPGKTRNLLTLPTLDVNLMQ